MKRFFALLLVPVFLFTVFVFSPSVSASSNEELTYFPLELDRDRGGIAANVTNYIYVQNLPRDILNQIKRIVIVGYIPDVVTLEGFTRVSSHGYHSVFVKEVPFTSDVSTLAITNSASSSSGFFISYAYAELISPSYTISSGRYDDRYPGANYDPSLPSSNFNNVTFPNYWTNFSFFQLVLPKDSVIGSSSVRIPIYLDNTYTEDFNIADLNCQVFSGGLPVDFSLDLDAVNFNFEGYEGYGFLNLNGPFFEDIVISFYLGETESLDETYTLHVGKPVCFLNPVLSEEQALKSINELLASNFTSINSLLGQINSGISTSNSWLSSIWTAISNGFSSVGNWFATTWNNLITGFNSVVSSITTGAQDIIDALWELLGPVEPADPPFSDSVGDLGALEDGILTDTDIGRQDFSNISGSAMSSIIGLSAAFYGASFLLTYFLELPFINTLLVLSLSLGVFAAFTGIVMSFRSAAERRPNRSQQRSNGNNKSSGG